MIRSLDGNNIIPTGEQGMIYVAGPSIFGGYIDPALESPFEQFDDLVDFPVMSTESSVPMTMRHLAPIQNPPSIVADTPF